MVEDYFTPWVYMLCILLWVQDGFLCECQTLTKLSNSNSGKMFLLYASIVLVLIEVFCNFIDYKFESCGKF